MYLDERKKFIKRMSVSSAVPEEVIEKIIAHQFSAVASALKCNNSVEISGFGRFVLSKSSIARAFRKWEYLKEYYQKELANPEIKPDMKRNREARIKTMDKNITALKRMLHESQD